MHIIIFIFVDQILQIILRNRVIDLTHNIFVLCIPIIEFKTLFKNFKILHDTINRDLCSFLNNPLRSRTSAIDEVH